jgi:hypothetical protein
MRTPIRIAVPDLLILSGCSNAMAEYPRTKMAITTPIINGVFGFYMKIWKKSIFRN